MFDSLDELIADLVRAAMEAANPAQAIGRYLQRDGDNLIVENRRYNLTTGDVRCIAVGKAAVPMAQAVAEILGDCISTALVVTKSEQLESVIFPEGWEAIAAGHPTPNYGSLQSGDRIWNLLADCTPETLIIACISGGASALVAAPQLWGSLIELLDANESVISNSTRQIIHTALLTQHIDITNPESLLGADVSLAALQAINTALLNSGLNIERINAVRAKLDRLKAGGLVRRAHPGKVIGLILSDVVGDSVAAIASGLTNHPAADNTLVGNNRQACIAVARTAEKLGYDVHLITTELEGEARVRGGEIAREIITRSPKTILIYGGETTVTLPTDCQGKGGRNQELALAAAIELSTQSTPAWVITLATDGIDGPTDGAGAMVNHTTISRSRDLGLDARLALDHHDSYPFFQKLGDLRQIGSTGTNVADIAIAIRP